MKDDVIVNFIKTNVLGKTVNKYKNKGSSNFQGYLDAAGSLGVIIKKETKNLFSFWYQGQEVGKMHSLRPSLVSSSAASVCRSKSKTLNVLDKADVQKKDHFIFDLDLTEDEVSNIWNEVGFLRIVVVKPTMSRGGDGVSVGVKTKDSFLKAWIKAKKSSDGKGKIIVEPFFSGLDVRVVVVGGR